MKASTLIASYVGLALVQWTAALPQPGGPVTADPHSKDTKNNTLEARENPLQDWFDKFTYLGSISVTYGSDPSQIPPNAILDANGGSADINHGFGGDYVWLTPVQTDEANAVVGLDAECTPWLCYPTGICGHSSDVAKGAGGSFTYIYWYNEEGKYGPRGYKESIMWKQVFLYRSRSSYNFGSLPEGFNGISGDINQGRGGDYLYLVWN